MEDLRYIAIGMSVYAGMLSLFFSVIYLVLGIYYKFKKSKNAKFGFRGSLGFLVLGLTVISIAFYKYMELKGQTIF